MTQTPPFNVIAERHLLGGLIIDPSTLPECMSIIPGPEVFWLRAHSVLFGLIVSLSVAEAPVDSQALAVAADRAQDIVDAGGQSWIAKLAEESPGPATLPHHARIIRDLHQRRMLMVAGEQLAQDAAQANERTADDIAASAAERIAKAVSVLSSATVKIGDASAQVVEALCSAKPAYLPTPWPEFDIEFGGLAQGCINTFMGTPSSGKTTLCLQLIRHLAGVGIGTMIFSNEQGPRRVAASMLTMESGVPVHDRWGRGTASVDEIRSVQQAAERLATLPIEQVSSSMNASQIVQQARFAKQRGFRVVFVDYLQQLPALPDCHSDRERIAESMKMLSRIRDLDMTLLLVSQIDKSTSKGTAMQGDSKRRISMFDGLGAAEIEQGSDWMFSVFRPHQHETPGDDIDDWRERQGTTELAVLKAKFGARGMFALRFHPLRMEFSR